MVVGVVAVGYHLLVGLAIWSRIACAIGDVEIDSVRHLVCLADRGGRWGMDLRVSKANVVVIATVVKIVRHELSCSCLLTGE